MAKFKFLNLRTREFTEVTAECEYAAADECARKIYGAGHSVAKNYQIDGQYTIVTAGGKRGGYRLGSVCGTIDCYGVVRDSL